MKAVDPPIAHSIHLVCASSRRSSARSHSFEVVFAAAVIELRCCPNICSRRLCEHRFKLTQPLTMFIWTEE